MAKLSGDMQVPGATQDAHQHPEPLATVSRQLKVSINAPCAGPSASTRCKTTELPSMTAADVTSGSFCTCTSACACNQLNAFRHRGMTTNMLAISFVVAHPCSMEPPTVMPFRA